ncbi:MAG TPA: FtsX-like permease family protein [candidate division Zixibacteria bacterium]|nr:FtsX-like permease family protein [candidate division Zixibacteria bacterium]
MSKRKNKQNKEDEIKGKFKTGFFFSLAFKNILSHKRHMGIIIFGFTISITMLLSVYYWSGTSEELALNDFLETQDYQSYILSSESLSELSDIKDDLENNPLVELYNTAFSTNALFNTEDLDLTYECLPEDEQEDPSNPVSITNALLAEQVTLDRIKFLFNLEGNFSLENHGILLSLFQQQELSRIYGKEIGIGDFVNLSLARYIANPSYGQDSIIDFNPSSYEDYRVNGIFTIQDGVSIIQSAFDLDWLSDSIIFPADDVSNSDLDEMVDRSIPYIIFIKFDKDEITSGGLDKIVENMDLFSENIKADYPNAFVYVLTSPLISLQNAYSRATITVVFMIPIILVGLILTIFMVNIVVESRKGEIALLRDRGADAIQILLLFIVEFIIVSLIGIVLGITFAYFVAAIIPAFTSSGFSSAMFFNFLTNMKMAPAFTILVSMGFLLILVGYTSFRIWWDVARKSKDTANLDESRKRFERNILLGINIGMASVVLIALIFSLIDTINQVRESSNYSITSTVSAGYTFILFCLVLIFGSQIISFLLTEKLQTNLKGLYKRLIFNDAFFLQNNFKRKDKKLSTMTFALVIISSVIVFSLVATTSVGTNQQMESDYKNGADLRIMTYPIEYTFENNISQFEGVNEVLPIFKGSGSIAYEDYTIYGVDPIKYSRIGYWDSSSFFGNESFEILQRLDATYDGVIIGSEMAERLNLTISDELPISGLPGGKYFQLFEIVGIINSAPGLGLADGENIELLQPNDGFILINQEYMMEELEVTQCQYFFVSVLPDYDPDLIALQIEEAFTGINANPSLLNEEFLGSFVEAYIPNVLTFFWIELIATAVIGVVLIIMFTDFTLSQRTHEYAITFSMGLSRSKITKLVTLEIIIIILCAALSGIVLGILFTYATFYLITPLLTAHNIIPFLVTIPIWQTILFPIIMTLIALLGILPSIRKYSRQDIILSLRA